MASSMSRSLARLAKAEQVVRDAKAAHEEAFLEACAALFNRYGLRLEAGGSEGSRLEVVEFNGRIEAKGIL